MIKRFKPFSAPKDLNFKDPDTGYLFEAADRKSLIRHIVSYRAQNQLPPIEHLDTVLENYWCEQPMNIGSCTERPLAKGFLYYLKGGVKLIQQMIYKSFVSQEEADRRSDICAACPKNVFPDRGAFVTWANAISLETIGNRKSRNHDKLGNCKVCDCLMKAKVWYNGKLGLKKAIVDAFPDFCWQKRIALKELNEKSKA